MKMTEEKSVNKLHANGIMFDKINLKLMKIKSPGVGIKLWAHIDFLCHYRGYS